MVKSKVKVIWPIEQITKTVKITFLQSERKYLYAHHDEMWNKWLDQKDVYIIFFIWVNPQCPAVVLVKNEQTPLGSLAKLHVDTSNFIHPGISDYFAPRDVV